MYFHLLYSKFFFKRDICIQLPYFPFLMLLWHKSDILKFCFNYRIPCDPVVDDVNTMVSGSITYIEGPWSNPTQEDEPFSIQVFESSDTEISQHMMIGANSYGQFTDQGFPDSANRESIKVEEYLEHNASQSLQCSAQLSSPCTTTNHDAKTVHCSDLPIPNFEKITHG